MERLNRALWMAGFPARMILVGLIRLYRAALSPVVGGGCRFHPSCSAYAEEAIRNTGALRGSVLAGWRILRCSPLSRGGVDLPPAGRPHRSESGTRRGTVSRGYDAIIHTEMAGDRS